MFHLRLRAGPSDLHVFIFATRQSLLIHFFFFFSGESFIGGLCLIFV